MPHADPCRRDRWPRVAAACAVAALGGWLALLAACALWLGPADALYHLRQPQLWERLRLTLATAGMATVVAMAVGVPGGYALSRLSLPLPTVIATVIDLPVMIPAAAAGMFLIGAVQVPPAGPVLQFLGLRLSHATAGVVVCQVVVTVAFAVRLSAAAFDTVPRRYEYVARSLGASPLQAVLRVTMPAARRGLIRAAVVVFARAAAEWEAVMIFVGATQGSTDVLPFAVYLDWNGGLMGAVVTMSLVTVAVAVAAASAASLLAEGGR